MLACDAVIAWEPEFASLAAAVGMEDAAGTDAEFIKRLSGFGTGQFSHEL